MNFRQLGRTKLKISEIGYGAWGIGQSQWVGAEDELSLKSLKAALDAGVNFFDTALAYGDGHSERLLARAFGKSNDVIIASKVPPRNRLWPARPGSLLKDVFPRDYVLSCLDKTLKNLDREAVDVFQFHVWNDDWAGLDEWQSTVQEIRASGKARFIGLSINDHQPANSLKALATGLVDVVQVIYNIFDQSPQDELLPYCSKNNIGVIARVPFDEGSLTGKIRPDTEFPAGDFRNYSFRDGRKKEVWSRVEKLVQDTGIRIEQLPQEALRFCLSHDAVSTVIPGMRNPAHVASNVAASNLGALSPDLLERLRRHRWVRNYYS
jgi:aryl-alcohol dehydrogenase-like predicted oxidoreductase